MMPLNDEVLLTIHPSRIEPYPNDLEICVQGVKVNALKTKDKRIENRHTSDVP